MSKLNEPGLMVAILVILVAVGFDVLVYLVPTRLDHDLFLQILTTINTGGFIAAVQYAIGSSSSSHQKDTTIQSLADPSSSKS